MFGGQIVLSFGQVFCGQGQIVLSFGGQVVLSFGQVFGGQIVLGFGGQIGVLNKFFIQSPGNALGSQTATRNALGSQSATKK